MLKAYKYRLYPTEEQKILLAKTFGCCRYIYNWGLAFKTGLYKAKKKGISVFDLMKEMKKLKEYEETKWLKEVNSQALQESLCNLDNAFTRFFRYKKGFPRFKSKSNKQSFTNTQNTKVLGDKLYIPKFKKGIDIVLHRKLEGKIKSSTVTKTPTNKYFVSILTEDNKETPKTKQLKENRTLGIDLGLTNYLTDSNSKIVENPRHLKKKLHALKRAQKSLSRKQKNSHNQEKQKLRVARLYEKVTNSRKDFLHKLTRKLVENQNYDSIAMENLDVVGLLQKGKKNKLSRHISDASWGQFRNLLEYKCRWYGKNLLFIGRFEPSSKLCTCGNLANLTLKDREWTCSKCGETHNRDKLAAQNIKHFAFCKQNTKNIGQELSKFKLVENGVSCSLKQETATL